MRERTLAIVKPDAVAKNIIGEILRRWEKAGLRIVAAKMTRMSKKEAERFYSVHSRKPFFASLIEFMSSGPIVVAVLEGEEAIGKNRDVMGSTDPALAAPGTIRRDFGTDVEKNAVHGSDSRETAEREIPFFFGEVEIWS